MRRLAEAAFLFVACAAAGRADKPVPYAAPPAPASWSFKARGDGESWLNANPNAGLKIDHGRLEGASGEWILSPPFRLPPAPQQVVEIRLTVERDTALSVEGIPEPEVERRLEPAGGVEAVPVFPSPAFVRHSRRMETVRIAPFWQGPALLQGLRIRLHSAGKYEIESVRVIELATLPEPGSDLPDLDEETKPLPLAPSPSPGPRWEFAETADGWSGATGIAEIEQWLGVLHIRTSPNRSPDFRGIVLSPPLTLDAGALPWLSIRIKAPKGGEAGFLWARPDRPGIFLKKISLKTANEFVDYSTSLSGSPGWAGRIAAVGLQIPADSTVDVDYVRLGVQP